MPDYSLVHEYDIDITQPSLRKILRDTYSGDDNADTIILNVMSGIEAVDMDGYTATLIILRPDWVSISKECATSGNEISVTFPYACYAAVGNVSGTICLVKDNEIIRTLFAFEYENRITRYDTVIDADNDIRLVGVAGLSELINHYGSLNDDMTNILAAELLRVTAEDTRVANENARLEAESARAQTEASRAEAESGRVSAESGRSAAEASRVTAERGRTSNETSRGNSEQTRVTNENARTLAEQGRVDAENNRVSRENTSAQAESTRVQAETARVSAEEARSTAESARGTAESNRSTAETNRASSETDRVNAEASRVTAEGGRVVAEGDRVLAEQAREAAEAQRAAEAAHILTTPVKWSDFNNSVAFGEETYSRPATYSGRDLSASMTEVEFKTAVSGGDFTNIYNGDYWPITISGTYRDYADARALAGTIYYSDEYLTNVAGELATNKSVFYRNYAVASFYDYDDETNYYVSAIDVIDWTEKTVSNATAKLEVNINPYMGYDNFFDNHVLFVSRDTLPFALGIRNGDVWFTHIFETTGDGVTERFELPEDVVGTPVIWVNRVKQSLAECYVMSHTLYFTTPPADGAEIFVRYRFTNNPMVGSALYETFNNPVYGLANLVAQTPIGAYMYTGANGKGMKVYAEMKDDGETTASGMDRYDRGRIFLLCEREVWGQAILSEPIAGSSPTLQLPIFIGSLRHIVKHMGDGGSGRVSWMLASTCAGENDEFCCVGAGRQSTTYTNTRCFVPLCFLV